jgi:hypothetical protein
VLTDRTQIQEKKMTDINILKAAATRVASWKEKHGIVASWKIDPNGLSLVVEHESGPIEKHVSWFEIDLQRYPARKLIHTEAVMLSLFKG